MNALALKLIPCDPFKAALTQSTCEHNHHIALEAYRQIRAGKALGDLDDYTIDRLIACGGCHLTTELIDTTFLMDKARAEVKEYIDMIDTCMTKNVDPLPPGEAQRQSAMRQYRKLSKAEEREAVIIQLLQEHHDEWVVPSEHGLPPATFEVVARIYKHRVIKTTQVTQHQYFRSVYMWVGEEEEESAESAEVEED